MRPFIANMGIAGIFGTVSILFLYLRPTPFDAPYVLDWTHYMFDAVFYSWYGVAILSAPFLAAAAFARGRWPRLMSGLSALHVLLLFLSLVVGHVDAELTRYMGIRLSWDFITTYVTNVGAAPDAIWSSIADDAGGAYSSVWLLAVPISFVVAVGIERRRPITVRLSSRTTILLGVAGFVVLFALPFLFRTPLFGGKNRQDKVKPPVILVYDELADRLRPKRQYADIETKLARVREAWREVDTASWRFSSTRYPLWKSKAGACEKTDRRWNVVLIVLETFRALDMKAFNPAHALDTTPFLDGLTARSDSAHWARCISNGQPTIVSFMAIQTGMLPHSRKSVAKGFPLVATSSLPGILKQNGYFTAFFTGSDPDGENQTVWLKKWYDKIHYDAADNSEDRRVFREAARFLKSRPSGDRPFLATLFSITNHTPFDSPEPDFNLTAESRLSEKINNTMHYTDDVVRELFESLRGEPWFDDTIFVITGDHGYDLGERGEPGGHVNIRHETNWVPLIIVGPHGRLPRGKQLAPASHVDLAPTILDLLGICADNGFVGHSLLSRQEGAVFEVNLKGENLAAETPSRSFYFKADGTSFLYDAADLLQRDDLADRFPDEVQSARDKAALFSEVTDYLYERDLIAPRDR